MSAIADLVTFLLSTGIPPESVSVAVDLASKYGDEQVEIHRKSTRIPPDSAAEKRRAWDRERKRNSTGKQKTPLILTSLSSSEETLKERKKESSGIRARARKQLTPLPENWQPPAHATALAVECGTSVPQVEPIFRDYLKSSGKLYADHDAAFCNFVRNQRKFNGANGHGRSEKPKSPLIQAADDLLATIRGFDGPAKQQDLGIRDGARPPALRLLPDRGRE